MLYSIRIILLALTALSAAALVGLVFFGCAPPRTAADAERCRLEVDREKLPELVAEGRANCPRGGHVEDCVSAKTIEEYQRNLESCRESR